MSIIVSGTVEFSPQDAERVLRDGRQMMLDTREQHGCIAYVWSEDPTQPGRLWVYERWENETAFAAHLAGPCYSGMLAILHNYPILAVDVAKHRVDLSEPVYDPAGKPRADFFTAG